MQRPTRFKRVLNSSKSVELMAQAESAEGAATGPSGVEAGAGDQAAQFQTVPSLYTLKSFILVVFFLTLAYYSYVGRWTGGLGVGN